MMTLTDIILRITEIIKTGIPVLVSLAILYFVWGLAQWILNIANTDKHEEGKQRMIWGMVALFFIVSIGGLVAILQATFFNGASGSNFNTNQGQFGTPPPTTSLDSGFSGNNSFSNSGGSVAPTSNSGAYRIVGNSNTNTGNTTFVSSQRGGGSGFSFGSVTGIITSGISNTVSRFLGSLFGG